MPGVLPQDIKVVLLMPSPPTATMRVMLTSHRAHSHCKALQGCAFNESDLARADILRAVAVFVMRCGAGVTFLCYKQSVRCRRIQTGRQVCAPLYFLQ
jgi:hypothetical protein